MTSPEVVRVGDTRQSSQLGRLTPEWLELAGRLEETSYFQTPDWVLGWWETIAGRPPTDVAAWRSPSGRLEALVALSKAREPLHRRLPLGVPIYANSGSGPGIADHCGWLVPPDRRSEVAAWVSETIGGSTLLLRGIDPAWDGPPLPSGARVVESVACPRMPVPGPEAAVGRSPNFRRQLGRFTRRLKRGGVRFEWVPPGRVDEPLLMALFELHQRVRANRSADTSLRPDQIDLHRRLCERAAEGRGPAALVARRQGDIAGVLYGYWWKNTFAAYQSGWDPSFSGFSMGSVLIYQAIRLAGAHGARTFDFLRGAESYKYRFGAVDRYDRTWMVARGPTGLLLGARYRAREQLRARRSAKTGEDYARV